MCEAVEACTCGAAFAEDADTDKATLEPGKLADQVILSEDILVSHPEALLLTYSVGQHLVAGRSIVGAIREPPRQAF